jgi:hypothetical protein
VIVKYKEQDKAPIKNLKTTSAAIIGPPNINVRHASIIKIGKIARMILELPLTFFKNTVSIKIRNNKEIRIIKLLEIRKSN